MLMVFVGDKPRLDALSTNLEPVWIDVAPAFLDQIRYSVAVERILFLFPKLVLAPTSLADAQNHRAGADHAEFYNRSRLISPIQVLVEQPLQISSATVSTLLYQAQKIGDLIAVQLFSVFGKPLQINDILGAIVSVDRQQLQCKKVSRAGHWNSKSFYEFDRIGALRNFGLNAG